MERGMWRPIRHCPGRFILSGASADLPPESLLEPGAELSEFIVPAARDRVIVALLDGGGLISYKRTDGTYLHTLNSLDGFWRKLLQLGIDIDLSGIPGREIEKGRNP